MPPQTHAGGIVVRAMNGRTEILMVRAKLPPHDWVLPKGHIEPGETAEACARREIQEEAGVDAAPLEPLGEDTFTTPAGKFVRAVFFLMHYNEDVPPTERRERRWFPVDEAITAAQFDRARELIGLAIGRARELGVGRHKGQVKDREQGSELRGRRTDR
jgi:8-oxo-dGTP pyrophosphatase MutT (NUDIX family)